MEDIARELNISIVSVSNALKNKKGVGEELRQTVKEKAAEMGYRLPESASEKEAEEMAEELAVYIEETEGWSSIWEG